MINPELEQAVIGTALVNNDAYPLMRVTADDFADPVHQRIWKRISARIERDHLASPVTLKSDMEGDEGLSELGGPAYLARLAGASISLFAAKEYGAELRALADKRRLSEMLTEQLEALNNPEKDAASILGAVEAYGLARGDTGGAQVIPFQGALLSALSEAVAARSSEEIPGTPLGIPALDHLTGGLFPGDLCIIGGRPSMGKTGLALSGAMQAARAGKGVAIVSLEMTSSSLALRAMSEASARAGRPVPYSDIRRGNTSDMQHSDIAEAAQAIMNLPIRIIPPTVRDIGAIYAATKRAAKLFADKGTPLAMLVVDYLQLIRSSKQSRLDQISEISMALKGLAMQLDIPVVALSQLSRALESRDDKRPIMSDLRESGQIEQDADVILFCYRDEYYVKREQPDPMKDAADYADWAEAMRACSGFMDIIVAKQRMGDTGTVRVRYDASTNLVTGGQLL